MSIFYPCVHPFNITDFIESYICCKDYDIKERSQRILSLIQKQIENEKFKALYYKDAILYYNWYMRGEKEQPVTDLNKEQIIEVRKRMPE